MTACSGVTAALAAEGPLTQGSTWQRWRGGRRGAAAGVHSQRHLAYRHVSSGAGCAVIPSIPRGGCGVIVRGPRADVCPAGNVAPEVAVGVGVGAGEARPGGVGLQLRVHYWRPAQ